MLTIRRSEDRGHARHGWLESRHTFSFADFYDPEHMGFRTLRVINEDRVAASRGFGAHPHRDMEIVSYVLSGELEHRDSLGNGSVIRSGDVQRMSAGTGVVHSEQNPSASEEVHFLQIWILPAQRGSVPSYEQKAFAPEEKADRLRLVLSPDGAEGSVRIGADAKLYATRLTSGARVELALATGRHAWVQVVEGRIRLLGEDLTSGDGAALSEEQLVQLEGLETSEVLIFDLP